MQRNKRFRWSSLGTAGALLLLAASATAARNDLLVTLVPGNLVVFTLNGVTGLNTTRDGSLSFLTNDPFCVPTAAAACSYQVNHITLTLSNFPVVTSEGTYTFENTYAMIRGPLNVTDSGADISIPPGTPVEVGAIVSGPHVSRGMRINQATTSSELIVRMSPIDGILTLDGTLPFSFSVPEIGQTFTGSIAGMMDGKDPFVNTAPFVDAGDDSELTCPQVVTLTGSVASDLESNLNSYTWQLPGRPTLFGATPSIFLGEGTHVATLTVDDAFGGVGTDQVAITIFDPLPTFTSVPGAVEVAGCGAVALGSATATSPCGPVTVTNNAPASFTAGKHTVTWTATSVTGKQAQASQTVVVFPGDSPNCCPAGSNVIVGTPNNDTLNGTSGNDCILGLGAQDTINGGGGNDIISGGQGDDILSGGLGDDTISGGTGQDKVYGQDGNDTLAGGDGDDRLEGAVGDDFLSGGQGQDTLLCDAGTDEAHGGTGDDTLFGGTGDDLLDGQSDNDICTGNAGFDTLLSCTAQDAAESTGTPSFPGTPGTDVCDCKPNKCGDCTAQVSTCEATLGCSEIVECIHVTGSCNLPHECSGLCEGGRSAAAINAARLLASCFGGC